MGRTYIYIFVFFFSLSLTFFPKRSVSSFRPRCIKKKNTQRWFSHHHVEGLVFRFLFLFFRRSRAFCGVRARAVVGWNVGWEGGGANGGAGVSPISDAAVTGLGALFPPPQLQGILFEVFRVLRVSVPTLHMCGNAPTRSLFFTYNLIRGEKTIGSKYVISPQKTTPMLGVCAHDQRVIRFRYRLAKCDRFARWATLEELSVVARQSRGDAPTDD